MVSCWMGDATTVRSPPGGCSAWSSTQSDQSSLVSGRGCARVRCQRLSCARA